MTVTVVPPEQRQERGMFGRLHLFRVSWTLVDQGVVSLGSFAVNIVLARLLSHADYGVFAVVFALLLMLQVFNTTLIFYPLTIRIAALVESRDDLIWRTLLLLLITLVPLAITIAAGLIAFGEGRLVMPVLAWFVAWQVQEGLRRILFSEFRHRTAVVGDSVTYLGQAAAVLLLATSGVLSLPLVFLALAAASSLGALIHFFQIGVVFRRPDSIGCTARDYWTIGRWSLASSLATALRFNALIWLIGLAAGRAQVADFQAAYNIVHVINPVLIGLCNLIPQTAAHAHGNGISSAWRATRHYASIGFLPTVLYYAFVMASPDTMLRLFYGADSEYLDAARSVQILAAAFVLNYFSEMVCSFLHGINLPRIALHINLAGAVVTILSFFPLVAAFGWTGAAMTLALANGVRLLLSFSTLKRLVYDADARPA
jgi:O-antigen/teichoic acid export membrane protein